MEKKWFKAFANGYIKIDTKAKRECRNKKGPQIKRIWIEGKGLVDAKTLKPLEQQMSEISAE